MNTSIDQVLNLTAKDAETVDLTPDMLIAAACIEAASITANVLIGRALANNCSILIDLLNSTTGEEQKDLLVIKKAYVESLSSKYANKEYTIVLVDKVYTWAKRDLSTIKRTEVIDKITGALVDFESVFAWLPNDYAKVLTLKSSSLADAERKLSLITLLTNQVKKLNNNEQSLIRANLLATVHQDIANSKHKTTVTELNQLFLILDARIEAAQKIAKDYSAVVKVYNTALKQVNETNGNSVNLLPYVKLIHQLPVDTLEQVKQATFYSEMFSSIVKLGVYLNLTKNTEYLTVAGKSPVTLEQLTAISNVVQSITASVKAEKDKEELARKHAEEIKTKEDDHQRELKSKESAVKAQTKESLALEAFEELQANCELFGLPGFAEQAQGNPQMNRAVKRLVNLASDIEDGDELAEIISLYRKCKFDLDNMNDTYNKATFKLAEFKHSAKFRVLRSLETQFNGPTYKLAAELLQGVRKSADGLIHSKKVDTTVENVVVALYQLIQREYAAQGEKVKAS